MGKMKWIFGRHERRLLDKQKTAELLVHLDAAYSLARCLTPDELAAEEAVQEAFLNVSRCGPGVHAADVRVSVLTMVRNTCLDARPAQALHKNDGRTHKRPAEPSLVPQTNPPSLPPSIEDALHSLPPEFREVLFLREGCELSYPQISQVVNAPVGIVMSRLSRARVRLYESFLSKRAAEICRSRAE
jgi:RNA polymerase sigma-70 factor (ECF subfamily)